MSLKFLNINKILFKLLLKNFNSLFFFQLKKMLFFLAYIFIIFILKKYLKNTKKLKYLTFDRNLSKEALIFFIYVNFYNLFYEIKLKKKKKFFRFLFFIYFQYLKIRLYNKIFLKFVKLFYSFYELFFKNKILNFLYFQKQFLLFFKFINLQNINIIVKLCPIGINVILTDLLSFYQKQKLSKKFSLIQIIQNFYKTMGKSSYLIKGLFIKGLGRFTKRQRSSLYKQSFGSLLFKNFASFVTLSFLNIITKHSQCTIRFYINYNLRFFKKNKIIFKL